MSLPWACLPEADPLKVSIDPNGNLTTKTEGSDTWTYEWNAEDQLKRVTLNGNEVARFAYDPYGRRVEKVAGGFTTSYLYDGQDILREVRGGATLKYVQGPGIDQALAREEGSGALTYHHADGLGSILKRTSPAGAVVHEYRYDAWGTIEAGNTEPGYAFTGREWDPETGLYYYRARYYDPRGGRFIGEDPAGSSGTLYAYANNNPSRFVDPFGLKGRDQVVVEAFQALKDAKAEVEQREFGGLVCWDPICRSLYTTGPVKGPVPVNKYQRMRVDVFKAPCASGDTYAGYYHTHPPFSDPGVSGDDAAIADDPQRLQPAYVWLTAPDDGRVLRYDPTTGAPGQGKQTIVTTIPWP
jgi:RHS repeat-associated protein